MKSTKRNFVENEDGTVELGYGAVMKKSTYMKMRKFRDEYVRDNYRVFNIKINKNRYSDIIAQMESQDNLVAYIVDLVQKDMNAKAKKTGKQATKTEKGQKKTKQESDTKKQSAESKAKSAKTKSAKQTEGKRTSKATSESKNKKAKRKQDQNWQN